MAIYRVKRYGIYVTDIVGGKAEVLAWIRDNVPPAVNHVDIRGSEATERILMFDAQKSGYSIARTDV